MENKDYLTYEEAMEYLGCKRSTLYTLITDEEITTYKFPHNKRRYLASMDVERLKKLRETPWLAKVAT
jgi:excisionase family DNA binding protein